MGYIESAQKKPNPNVDVCKMHPFVRLMVNRIAHEAKFFEFDEHGTMNEEFSKSLRACLLYDKTFLVHKDNPLTGKEKNKLPENLHAILNVNKSNLVFDQDSISKMKNTKVLYLGRRQSLGTHHIEVDDTKILNAKKGNILDELQYIRNLKFLSLQGISRITELPKSIGKIQNLTVLDIRACHNLEKIPAEIGCLVNLTHLDMSEGYLLDEMPKEISSLTKLQVLSGFVVLEPENKKSCTLVDLKFFPDLRKLSSHTGSDKFPSDKDLEVLHQFKRLLKLTIAWGRRTANIQREENENENENKDDIKLINKAQVAPKKGYKELLKCVLKHSPYAESENLVSNRTAKLPKQLTKLDLQCFPGKTHDWLRPEKLMNLEKLYIRGGKLSDLGHVQDFEDEKNDDVPIIKWQKVKELRLKYLDEIELDWWELLDFFPNLEYLEKVDCPKLSFFPCNEIGVWTKKKTVSQ